MAPSSLKRIATPQLRLGMHVHEFCGSWMDHPFWRSNFLLRSETDLKRIAASGISELWIDTAKGGDIEEGQRVAEASTELAREPAPAASMPMPIEDTETGEAAIAKAGALYKRSVGQIKSLFHEARMGRAIDAQSCLPLVDDISASVLRNPGALVSVVRLKQRDEYTYMHSVAVCALMVSLGRQLGLEGDTLRQAGLAGMLHDLGKIAVPLEVLNKPGKLSDAEFEVVKLHPARGHEMLVEGGTAGEMVLDVCLHHHEKFDGSGYPHGLAGDAISLVAKMGAVCDVYDAVTSVRPYKDGWDPGEALRRMAQWKGHFDPRIFQAFIKSVGIYPTGSLVRLHSGKLAVVSAQHPESLLTPTVKAFYSLNSNMRFEPRELDLSRSADKIVGSESPEDWPFKDLDHLAGILPAR